MAAGAIGTLAINIVSKHGAAVAGMQQTGRAARGMGNQFNAVANSMKQMALRVVGVGAALMAFRHSMKLAADMEQAQVAFSTLIGDAGKAKQVLQDLTDFAASTPFQLPELTNAGRQLLAFGVAAEDVVTQLRRVGDVSAGIGAPIGEIAEIYGKAKVQGRLFMEDINQLTGRGIPIIQELAKQFGVTEGAVRDLVSKGKVNFGNLEQAFIDLTSKGGKFADMMKAQSETVAGKWSTMKDNLDALARTMGEMFLPIASKFVDWATQLAQVLNPLNSLFGELTLAVGAGTAAFAGTIWIIPKLISGFMALKASVLALVGAKTLLLALSGPKGWLMLAAGVAAAGVVITGLGMAMSDVTGKTETAQQSIASADQTIGDTSAISGRTQAVGELADETDRLANATGTAVKETEKQQTIEEKWDAIWDKRKKNLPKAEEGDAERAGGGTNILRRRPGLAAPEVGGASGGDRALAEYLRKQAEEAKRQTQIQQEQLKAANETNEKLQELATRTGDDITVKVGSLV